MVELASNDGYLLQHFVARGRAGARRRAGAQRRQGRRGARGSLHLGLLRRRRPRATSSPSTGHADLVPANNVLAHVPDINDFVAGIDILLAPHGVTTLEFPHILRLIEGNQFDTIYHEHYSYLSLFSVEQIFAAHGLRVVDVEELPTHGGSLRVYARHAERRHRAESPSGSRRCARSSASTGSTASRATRASAPVSRRSSGICSSS